MCAACFSAQTPRVPRLLRRRRPARASRVQVPDAVRFHAQQLLSGNWDPYPIDMSFQPPCMVLSTIGLAQPGKIMRGKRAGECERHLHQMHICAPSKRGSTRLLYRMSLDFMPWARHVPFIDRVWKSVAGQVRAGGGRGAGGRIRRSDGLLGGRACQGTSTGASARVHACV